MQQEPSMNEIVLDPESRAAVEAGAEACVEQWLAAEGDHVHAGQVLGRARLLHTLVDLPTPHAGVLEEIVVAAGERFVPGAVLARVAAV
jgi:pyruvate dehydrogenase E2 component (dihydrolipoamide acetyltransferase)